MPTTARKATPKRKNPAVKAGRTAQKKLVIDGMRDPAPPVAMEQIANDKSKRLTFAEFRRLGGF